MTTSITVQVPATARLAADIAFIRPAARIWIGACLKAFQEYSLEYIKTRVNVKVNPVTQQYEQDIEIYWNSVGCRDTTSRKDIRKRLGLRPLTGSGYSKGVFEILNKELNALAPDEIFWATSLMGALGAWELSWAEAYIIKERVNKSKDEILLDEFLAFKVDQSKNGTYATTYASLI